MCCCLLKIKYGEQDGGGVGGHGVHLSPRIHQEYIFRHRDTRRTPAESIQEYLTVVKNIKNHTKLVGTKELGVKTGVLLGLGLPSAVGELKQGSSPHTGATV